MGAEAPTQPQQPQRPQLAITNRGQVLLFALLTLILSAITVWAGRIWLTHSETLTFAVGAPDSEDAHFAERLAAILKNNSSRFRLKIVNDPDNAKALSLFDRRLADLALLRTDAKIPPRARALAIVEHDPVLLISPGDKKIKSLDDLKKKKIAVLAEGDKDAFVMAHPGAADYINDDTKSFMDRYSDMMYLGAAALSVIGSFFAAIYAQFTRVSPGKAGALATAILTIGEKVENAHCIDDIEQLQEELEKILRGAVIGLRDGTISCDGLETFKLGYELVRDEITIRREHLLRHAGDDAARDVALFNGPGKPSKEAAE